MSAEQPAPGDPNAFGLVPPAVPAFDQPWTAPPLGGEPARQIVAVTPKSAGVAVLLSFLWLGAGNLYVNQIGAGILLLVIHLFLVMMTLTFIGAVLSVPLWVVLFAVAAGTSAGAANRHNRRLGISG